MAHHAAMRHIFVAHTHQFLAVDIDVGAAAGGRRRREMACVTGADIGAAMGWRHSLVPELKEAG